jgi:hypothetical protein
VRTYYRQYMGLVGLDGRAFILINAFAAEYLDDTQAATSRIRWQTQPFQVCDGGDSFWSVEADPETGGFRAFAFDGSA